ncbi:MAG: YraN family protein [Mariprofundaceae bacterium]|nr:YraN family protein [Mariprofundaceae bacterium]
MSTKKGRIAETQAARYLQKKAYIILDRNARGGRGELDIVAQKDEILVFVEVKAHQQRESSLEAMHIDKCERLRSAALAWLSKHSQYTTLQCRFDLIILTPRQGIMYPPKIEHLTDIFR